MSSIENPNLPNDGTAENGPWSKIEGMPPIKECCSSWLIIGLQGMDRHTAFADKVLDELLYRAHFYDLADRYRNEFRAAVEQQLDQPKTDEVR